MSSGPGDRFRPLVYPGAVTVGALAVCAVLLPLADADQLAALATVMLVIVGYSGVRAARALGVVSTGVPAGERLSARRVRQQHRLVSRSWLEITAGDRRWWVPVYFAPELVGLTVAEVHCAQPGPEGRSRLRFAGNRLSLREFETGATGGAATGAVRLRVYPSGRARTSEPPGRLIDNPVRSAPDADERARVAARVPRRLLLDAQPAVAAPVAALLWVYLDGGGLPAFTGALVVGAAAAVWLTAVRGSDPS
ncbi:MULTISPECIES: hypothetical protein [Nocardia]|uniref:hypothetical protein n=1 Tax=Nocardia TaxID=1817 RepID=UPI001E3483F1|nr:MULTISPECIES: hypothetical protein [Nocardia]UEX23053.1 hypothetical protein LMJ57_00540 [Nocardia farcinica]